MTETIKNQCLLFLIPEMAGKNEPRGASDNSEIKGFALLPGDFKTQLPKIGEVFLQNGLQIISNGQNLDCLRNHKFEVFELLVTAIKPNRLTVFARKYDKEFVGSLLTKNVSVKFVRKFGSMNIRSAVDEEGLKIIKQLLTFEPDIPWRHEGGGTFMHIAVKRGDVTLVKLLLENHANVNAERDLGSTSLHIASKKGLLQICQLLVENGAKVDPDFVDGSTPLHVAVDKGHLQIVEYLLKNGANTESKITLTSNRIGGTPLHYAISRKHSNIVDLLLKNGAQVDAECCGGVACLQLAVDHGHSKMAESILDYHPDVNNKSNQKAFRNAVLWTFTHDVGINVDRFKKSVEKMVQLGFMVNPEDAEDFGLLYGAVCLGNTEITRKLLEYGAEVNKTCDTRPNMMPFLAAAMLVDGEEMMKLLLDFGADINAITESGSTAMRFAISRKRVNTVKFLLENGFNIFRDPGLVYDASCISTPPEILEIILLKGGDANFETPKPDMFDPENLPLRTPLMVAVSKGALGIVEVLLKYGARIDFFEEMSAMTPLLQAVEESHLEIFQTLLDCGFTNTNIVDLANTFVLFDSLSPSRKDTRRDIVFKESGRKALAYHLLKLEAEQLCPLNINALVTVHGFQDSWVNEFLGKCKAELMNLKTGKVGNTDITFHNILTQNVNQIACFARNESFVETLMSEEYRRNFPIYAGVINWQFQKGFHRKNLLEQSIKISQLPSNKLSALPFGVQEKIFCFLSDQELIIFNVSF